MQNYETCDGKCGVCDARHNCQYCEPFLKTQNVVNVPAGCIYDCGKVVRF